MDGPNAVSRTVFCSHKRLREGTKTIAPTTDYTKQNSVKYLQLQRNLVFNILKLFFGIGNEVHELDIRPSFLPFLFI